MSQARIVPIKEATTPNAVNDREFALDAPMPWALSFTHSCVTINFSR